jgi:hypothetical protein
VTFAGNSDQRAIFYHTFPGIESIALEGYNVRYTQNSSLITTNLLLQIPGICATIRRENNWLKDQTNSLGIDGIISDNRYGLYHPKVPSVILTHQLRVLSGAGRIMDDRLQRIHYKFLQKFNEVWVPDVIENDGLAGQLSHPTLLPINCNYIGFLSQFDAPGANYITNDHLLILLSGLEPQRTMLADALWQLVSKYEGQVSFVAGSFTAASPHSKPSNITYYPFLGLNELTAVLANANKVICRSGYSTIMDLVKTRKNALLIPTPGQTEQEYLADFLHQKGHFVTTTQKSLDITAFLNNKAADDKGLKFDGSKFNIYKSALDRWTSSL